MMVPSRLSSTLKLTLNIALHEYPVDSLMTHPYNGSDENENPDEK